MILSMLWDRPSLAWQRPWPAATTHGMARAGLLPQGRFVSLHVLCKRFHTPYNLAILIPDTSDATQGLTFSGE